MKNILFKYTLFLFVAISATSCVSHKFNYIQMEEGDVGQVFQKNIPEYRIQPQDKLTIMIKSPDGEADQMFNLFGGAQGMANMNMQNNQNSGYWVNDEGNIELPVIGDMHVQGLTIAEVKAKVETVVNKYFQDVYVMVRMNNYPIYFLGEVESMISINKEHLNVLEAIGMAGGIPETGNKKQVHVFRQNAGETKYYTIDLTHKELLTSEDYFLMPNDIVYIEPLPLKKIRTGYADYMFFLTSFTTVLTTVLLIWKL